ncbi:MAG TPA: hypothetical protein VM166_06955 [Gemmatimonadaceae bacterium]|nr:hypothetical protein [Gemmatimonadaceae bacterium]
MKRFSVSASDDELIAFIDGWAALLEREDYESAFRYTDQNPAMEWTPEKIRAEIKGYGKGNPDQRVTVQGVPSDVTQTREISRSTRNRDGRIGEIWYDLNINGVVSDLTATFDLIADDEGLRICLNDIHVM